MNRSVRSSATALTLFAVLAGATACESLTETHREEPGFPAVPSPPAVTHPSVQELEKRAQAALSDPDDGFNGTFHSSFAGGTHMGNQDDALAPGVPIVVEVACAGEGALTFGVSSGKSVSRVRLTCSPTASRREVHEFAPPARSVFFSVSEATSEHAAVAAVVRIAPRPAS
ncbi:hypothetical protein [Streptomyces sp. NPDC051561]|uniref:hypothetical protein n=1 Tax=Streptomyces sp. NPDC051561 TaxID=3365658 RepID=UPI0037BA11F3